MYISLLKLILSISSMSYHVSRNQKIGILKVAKLSTKKHETRLVKMQLKLLACPRAPAWDTSASPSKSGCSWIDHPRIQSVATGIIEIHRKDWFFFLLEWFASNTSQTSIGWLFSACRSCKFSRLPKTPNSCTSLLGGKAARPGKSWWIQRRKPCTICKSKLT